MSKRLRHVGWFLVVGLVTIGASKKQVGEASWYSTEACRYNRHPACLTASGASLYTLEAEGILFAAMWGVPFGTRLRVCVTTAPARCVPVVVLDRGPNKRLGRVIDLSKAAFQQLTSLDLGTINISIEEENVKR